MVTVSIQGIRRQRVDRVRPDQRLDIHHVIVCRVLGRCGCPKQPLRTRTLCRQRLPTYAVNQSPIFPVSEARTGNRRSAAQFLRLWSFVLINGTIHHGIDAAQEETRNRCDVVKRTSACQAIFQAGNITLRHFAVAYDTEKKCHVHVDACGDQLPDRRQTLPCRRHLDHQVGTCDASPQALCFGNRRCGLIGKTR